MVQNWQRSVAVSSISPDTWFYYIFVQPEKRHVPTKDEAFNTVVVSLCFFRGSWLCQARFFSKTKTSWVAALQMLHTLNGSCDPWRRCWCEEVTYYWLLLRSYHFYSKIQRSQVELLESSNNHKTIVDHKLQSLNWKRRKLKNMDYELTFEER